MLRSGSRGVLRRRRRPRRLRPGGGRPPPQRDASARASDSPAAAVGRAGRASRHARRIRPAGRAWAGRPPRTRRRSPPRQAEAGDGRRLDAGPPPRVGAGEGRSGRDLPAAAGGGTPGGRGRPPARRAVAAVRAGGCREARGPAGEFRGGAPRHPGAANSRRPLRDSPASARRVGSRRRTRRDGLALRRPPETPPDGPRRSTAAARRRSGPAPASWLALGPATRGGQLPNPEFRGGDPAGGFVCSYHGRTALPGRDPRGSPRD